MSPSILAFRLGYEIAPEWFDSAIFHGRIHVFEERPQDGTLVVEKVFLESCKKNAGKGDFIVKDQRQCAYPDSFYSKSFYEFLKESPEFFQNQAEQGGKLYVVTGSSLDEALIRRKDGDEWLLVYPDDRPVAELYNGEMELQVRCPKEALPPYDALLACQDAEQGFSPGPC